MRAELPGLRRIVKATGGSTGVPLRFELDSRSHDKRMAATFRGYSWAGAGPGTRQLHLWGTSPVPQPFPARQKTRLYDWLYNRRVLGAFGLSEATTGEYLRQVEAFRPEVIVAYVNALYSFARSLKEHGLVPTPPRSIVVGAEKLHGFQRELIQEVFRAPVFETYGSREFMLMAAQCERRQGLHVTAENLIIEVVDDEGQPVPEGVEGRVVVTDLYNYAMPFVRYANGDRAVAGGRCDCGRGLPLLSEIAGRQADMLTTPDGRRVSGLYFPHLLKDFPAVRRFQVVQEGPAAIVLEVEAPDVTREELDRISTAVLTVLGPTVRFTIRTVSEIALSPAGKLLVVVNRAQRVEARSDGAAG
jgi:phenylacetate-CoA ligase